MGPLLRKTPGSRTSLYIFFRVLVKKPPPPGSDRRALIERDAPFPRLETYFSNDLFRISWSLKLSLLPIRLYTFLLSGV